MNFSDFIARKITSDTLDVKLKKNKSNNEQNKKDEKKDTTKKSTIATQNKTTKMKDDISFNSNVSYVTNVSHTHGYFRPVFRRGDLIKIVRMENSIHNIYKGYYGEILEYDKNSDYALVILDAKDSHAPIKCHVNHLQKRHD